MSNLTRDFLIKNIVAEEMRHNDGTNYAEILKDSYQRWEHESSYVLCQNLTKSNIQMSL